NYLYQPGPGTSSTLQGLETSFQQDLNGDGTIGIPAAQTTTIEAIGNTSLTQVGNNFFLNPTGGSSVQFSYLNSPVTAGMFSGWAPIGVERLAGGGFEVAWKNASAGLFSVWVTDSSGNFAGTNYLYQPGPGTSSTLKALEASFQQDLNGDGTIGAAPLNPSQLFASGSDGFNFNLPERPDLMGQWAEAPVFNGNQAADQHTLADQIHTILETIGFVPTSDGHGAAEPAHGEWLDHFLLR
ncbi:MAG: hypothetical protein DI543_25630, partial [Bradyrhizobium icense]